MQYGKSVPKPKIKPKPKANSSNGSDSDLTAAEAQNLADSGAAGTLEVKTLRTQKFQEIPIEFFIKISTLFYQKIECF